MRTGRPRSFCKEEALDRAMTVFWRNGYEGASLAHLTEAMGINSPSLYACFGSKEGLFKAVLERAMTVFWRNGYEGASLAHLTEAMGINSPSLYACFGSKEGLFKAVLE